MSKLSICVTVKNRSKIELKKHTLFLFPDLIKSIANSITLDKDIELVVADWNSSDWPIKLWIEEYFPYAPSHLINILNNNFSVGRGKNIAAQYATGDKLFFVDADMIINKEVIDFAISSIRDSTVYYPTVYYYDLQNKQPFIHEGGGNLFITKQDFIKTNGWPEYYAHGFDDVDFYQEISKKFKILTHPTLHIIHQWHPQEKEFKNKHATETGIKEVQNRTDFYTNENGNLLSLVQTELHSQNITHNKLNPIAKGV